MSSVSERLPFKLPVACVLLLTVVASPAPGATKGHWPGWRGDGSGVSSEEKLPVSWDEKTNIAWNAELPGEGNSSPTVWGDRVFLTAATEKGAKRHVLCLNAKDGSIAWQRELTADRVAATYPKNGYASSTAATDGTRVFAFFDSPGLVALDMDGTVLWTRDLGPFKTDWGMASSPVLCGDLVIMNCDHDTDSFIAGIEASTGNVRWKTARPGAGRQYATPLLISVDAKTQIVVNGGAVASYDTEGKELWSCRGMISMLTPSAVFDGGLVFVSSGRNGPSMAIDPRGRGNVSDTHVRMFFGVGGPYVPSPLVYPLLFLPGDNGTFRFIDLQGKEALTDKLAGHFTSSPVAGDGRIYWASESGDTFVIEVKGSSPKTRLLAANRLPGAVLASPAIANGCIYLRTDKRLYCIAGSRKAEAAAVAAAPPRSLEELRKLYDEHQAPEGADIPIRLDIVASLGRLKAPDAIAFLKQIALKDNHWDVSEEAVKVLGAAGEAAMPALLELLASDDWRPYLKIVPAGSIGKMKKAEAVPALVKAAGHGEPTVRIAAIETLAVIARAHEAEVPKALPVIVNALGDREGVVRRAAIDSVGPFAGKLADQREAVVRKMLNLAADRNPLVAERAAATLSKELKVPEEAVMNDVALYGVQRKEPVVANLAAGPVRMKFQDGELRYIKVGSTEIVRRIYFAVRDSRWDTVIPEFGSISIQQQPDGFRVTMEAVCRNDVADYRWTGTMTGKADGTVTFSVNGESQMSFTSYRVGICVLYGAESLAGQAFEVIDDKDAAVKGEFPKAVSPKLLAEKFKSLSYTLPDGVQVTCGLADGIFGMEDQRNFGDSSYKAFSGIAYKYPNVEKGGKGSQTLTLAVKNAKPAAEAPPAAIEIGQAVPGAAIPKLAAPQEAKNPGFMEYNGNPAKHAGDALVAMPYNPAAHMPDDDTYMENITAVRDQVLSIKAFATKAKFRIDPITIDSWYPRPGPDPRNRAMFAAPWCARMLKYMALAGTNEAAFKVGPGPCDAVLKLMAAYEGRPVLAAGNGPHDAVDCLAIDDAGRKVIWLLNTTDRPQQVGLRNPAERIEILRLNASSPRKFASRKSSNKDPILTVKLEPFEVCVIIQQK